jgi:steroid delta-isomerase-like uncharacterized protein
MGSSLGNIIEDYAQAWSRQDREYICNLFSDKLLFEDIPMGLHAKNKIELRDILSNTFLEVPDFTMEIKSILVGNSFAATEWLQSGTATGSIEGGEVKGLKYSVLTTSIIQFSEGKICRVSDNWDSGVFYKKI